MCLVVVVVLDVSSVVVDVDVVVVVVDAVVCGTPLIIKLVSHPQHKHSIKFAIRTKIKNRRNATTSHTFLTKV